MKLWIVFRTRVRFPPAPRVQLLNVPRVTSTRYGADRYRLETKKYVEGMKFRADTQFSSLINGIADSRTENKATELRMVA